MAHIQTSHMKLWKPQDLTIDKISSQKMFIDNIDIMEAFGMSMLGLINAPVESIDDLRAINTSNADIYRDGKIIAVKHVGIYQFYRTSDATDTNYDVITPSTGVGRWVLIGSSTNINEEQIEFTRPPVLTDLVYGETLSKAMGKLAAVIYDFTTHEVNKNNPHTVTTSQIGALANNFSNVAVGTEDALMDALDNAMDGMDDRTIKVIGITFTAKCGLFPQGARTIMTIYKAGTGYGNITAIVCSSARPEIIMRSWAAGVYSEWVNITSTTMAAASVE